MSTVHHNSAYIILFHTCNSKLIILIKKMILSTLCHLLSVFPKLRRHIGFADVSYSMADVDETFFVYKCTEHQLKCCYWLMLINIVLQMLCSLWVVITSRLIPLRMTKPFSCYASIWIVIFVVLDINSIHSGIDGQSYQNAVSARNAVSAVH